MKVYLDYASTTPVDPEVLETMLPFFGENFGNPDSEHLMGLDAKKAIDKARHLVADILNCAPSETIFTSGGTESNNLALQGLAQKTKKTLASNLEHSSILEVLENLKRDGFLTELSAPKEIGNQINSDTGLVTMMYANNETGTIYDIGAIAEICHSFGIPFHSDACQACGYLELDVAKLGVDLLTLNAGKIYGPKGVGLLYVKKGTKINPQIWGGGQESGLRGGTLNVPGIVGFAKALSLAESRRPTTPLRLAKLRDHLLNALLSQIPGSALNGPISPRLPNNINLRIPKIEGKELILHLSEAGIAVSTGAACSSSKKEASHVLLALGLTEEEARSSIRMTLGHPTTESEIEYAASEIPRIVKQLQTN